MSVHPHHTGIWITDGIWIKPLTTRTALTKTKKIGSLLFGFKKHGSIRIGQWIFVLRSALCLVSRPAAQYIDLEIDEHEMNSETKASAEVYLRDIVHPVVLPLVSKIAQVKPEQSDVANWLLRQLKDDVQQTERRRKRATFTANPVSLQATRKASVPVMVDDETNNNDVAPAFVPVTPFDHRIVRVLQVVKL
jgi:hypothetical protein